MRNVSVIDISTQDALVAAQQSATKPSLNFDTWEQNWRAQSEICDALELIADQLPQLDAHYVICVARALPKIVRRAQQFEENTIFPILENNHELNLGGAQTLSRLKFEHFEDSCLADEVSESMFDFIKSKDLLAPEALGYLLRSFFISLRRHLREERELISKLNANGGVH